MLADAQQTGSADLSAPLEPFALTLSSAPLPRAEPAAYPGASVPPDRLLRRREVEQLVGMKKTSIYAQMEAGTFPRAIALTPRCVVWSERAVQAWIEARKAQAVAA
jgi:prophage regulatory protein